MTADPTTDQLAYAALLRTPPAEIRAGRTVTGGRAHWTGAPPHDITLTAAILTAPTLADLEVFLRGCSPHATHVAGIHKRAALILTGTVGQVDLGDTQLQQIERLAAYCPPNVPTRRLPPDILDAPAGPVVDAMITCLKRASPTTRPHDLHRAHLQELSVTLYTFALVIESTMRAIQERSEYRPDEYHRAAFAMASATASPPAVQDFQGVSSARTRLLISGPATLYLRDDPDVQASTRALLDEWGHPRPPGT